MKRITWLTFAIGIGLLIQSSNRAQQIPDPGGVRTITTGSVVVETMLDGGGLLPRISVWLYPVNTEAKDRTSTRAYATSAPTFTLSGVPAGEYVVNGQQSRPPELPTGYSIQSITAGGVDLTTNPVRVTAGELTKISIVLRVSLPHPWIPVRGRISGFLESSVKPTSITIIGAGDMPDTTTAVDWRGAFEFPMVFPGIYKVRLDPPADSFPRKIVARTAGEMSPDIPLRLPTFVVSGTVEGAAKQGNISTARIVPTFGNDGFSLNTGFSDAEALRKGNFASTVPLDANGSFSFPGVPRGWYILSIGPGEMPVRVTDSDIVDLKFSSTSSAPGRLSNGPICSASLAAGARGAGAVPVRISGTAVMDDGAPPPPFDVLFRSAAGTRNLHVIGDTFSLSLPPGDYCVSYRIPGSIGIVRMWAGLTDLRDFPLKVSATPANGDSTISLVLFPHIGRFR